MNRTIACMVQTIAPNESAPFVNGTMRASFIGTDEEGRSFTFEADVYKSEARDLGALLYVPNAVNLTISTDIPKCLDSGCSARALPATANRTGAFCSAHDPRRDAEED